MYAPLLLNAGATVTTGSVLLNVFNTRNSSRGPLLVDGVRFNPGLDTSSGGVMRGGLNAAVWARITLGRQPLTAGRGGYVPIPGLVGIENNIASTGNLNGAIQAGAAYNWKFTKAMYVPAVENINTWIQLAVPVLGAAVPTSATTRVTYVTRPLPVNTKAPAKIFIPYAATWLADAPTSGTTDLISAEADLSNPFATPLYIDTLIIRSVSGNGSMLRNDVAQNPFIRMTDPDGRIIIRDLVPLSQVAPSDLMWNVNGVIRPGGFYKCYITPNGSWTGQARFIVTIRGYREVPYSPSGQL